MKHFETLQTSSNWKLNFNFGTYFEFSVSKWLVSRTYGCNENNKYELESLTSGICTTHVRTDEKIEHLKFQGYFIVITNTECV